MTEWFEDWFSTEEYLDVYSHRNDEDAKDLYDLILKNVLIGKNAKVLDLACGAGRHSFLFAKNGFDVTGVDISENLLNVAKRTAGELGLSVSFIKSDLRNLHLTENFSLIINLFTSFGYFESDDENSEVIKIASQHLVDNGYFIIDFFNVTYLKKNLISISYDKTDEGVIKQERIFEGNRIVKKITFNKKGNQKLYHESVRTFSKNELVSLMMKYDLKIQKIFGDYRGYDFEEVNSPRIIIIAKK